MLSFKTHLQLLFSLGVLPLLGAAHAPTLAPAHSTPSLAHAAVTFNPHLHIPAPASAPHAAVATAHATTAPTSAAGHSLLFTHSTWGAAWDAHAFIALHRGLATIRGEVRTAAGQPANAVRVALRKPKGRIFAKIALRHVTYTAPDGTFVMNDVRPGSYRVLATENKKKASAQKQVHADAVEMVSIKL